MAVVYHFQARPPRPADSMPIDYYSEDEAKVRRDAEAWSEREWWVKVDYGYLTWAPFDYKSSYRFKGGYEGD